MESTSARVRTGLFVALLLVINLVEDGLPRVASPFLMQVALLPITLLFLLLAALFLWVGRDGEVRIAFFGVAGDPRVDLWLVFLFESAFVCLFFSETSHYAALGYHLLRTTTVLTFLAVLVAVAVATQWPEKLRPGAVLAVFLGSYAAGHVLAILSFPLNHLRSDMLPVIFWADRALLTGGNPYQHFHVADRIYDFPYLPGMLLAFAPAQALHVDLRWAAIAYIVGGMGLIYWAATPEFRMHVAALIGLFVLCPYLQYRHELYTQGHFFSLILVFVLMQRRQFAMSAVAFGVSMVISQFSWVIFPFFLMNALRRGGWKEVARMALYAFVAGATLMVPFIHSVGNIGHNAVGQWDNLERAIARPINLAFWVSYVVRPSHLKWIQLVLLTGIFGFCWMKGRCADLTDTLRWMLAALIVFILLNVLLDGYFYLMLLVPMLVFTCVANGWWREGPEALR